MSIALQDLTKYFGDQLVVNKVSLQIAEGELFVLLGGSGSGKSTILRIIAGLLGSDSGTVHLNGVDTRNQPPQQRGVGMVFQNYALFKHMTVAQNIEFGLKIRKVPAEDRVARREEMLDLVGLGGLGDRYPRQLSGGQRQRVAVARAIAYKPSVLLLDEPFGALDVRVRSQLRESFRELQRKLKVTTVLVTHDQEEAFELADRIGVLERGRLVEVGTPRELYHAPHSEGVATFVGGGNVLVGRLKKDRIVLGEVSLPFPESAPGHDEGAPVRILIRPEAVRYQIEAFSDDQQVHVLGQATLSDAIFLGSQEKMRFEVPALHGVRQLAPAVAYGRRNPLIDATRASIAGLSHGLAERVWLGIRAFHVLQPFGLKVLIGLTGETARTSAVEFGSMLASAARGAAAILKVSDDQNQIAERKSLEALQKVLVGNEALRLEAKVRVGEIEREFVSETQEGFYEVVILDRPRRGEGWVGLESPAREILDEVGVPVLLVAQPRSRLDRILICTAGGEPGRTDVRVGGRIARQTGAAVTLMHVFRAGSSKESRERVTRHLEGAQSSLYLLGIESSILVREEPTITGIVEEVERGDFDLLVIGSPPPRAPGAVRSADFSREIVSRVDRPVLIVPPSQ